MLNPVPCILWPSLIVGSIAVFLVGRKWPRPNSSWTLLLVFLGVFLLVVALLLTQFEWALLVVPYIAQ